MSHKCRNFQIHEMVYELLKPVYTELQLGGSYHTIDSFHAYEKHFTMLFNIVKDSKFSEIEIPQMSGKDEVQLLRTGNYLTKIFPENYLFTKWLTDINETNT